MSFPADLEIARGAHLVLLDALPAEILGAEG